MNQSELVGAVAKATGVTKTHAARALEAITKVIATALEAGEEVRLSGFGTFSTTTREARQGRNPRTGEAIHIPASKTPKFSPGKGLKDAVNG